MDDRQFARLLVKYRSPVWSRADVPFDVLQDVQLLLAQMETHRSLLRRLHEELKGAQYTMMALTRAIGGKIAIPYALIELISSGDKLHVADVQRPDGSMTKEFSYRAAADATLH